jgi:hypothetical protein
LEDEQISKLCDQQGLQPTVFDRWQKEFFGDGGASHAEILKSIREEEPKYPASNLTAYLHELQVGKRGELLDFNPPPANTSSATLFSTTDTRLSAYDFESLLEPLAGAGEGVEEEEDDDEDPEFDFEPSDFEPSDFEPSDFELSDFEPSDFDPSNLEPSDFEPSEEPLPSACLPGALELAFPLA